MFTVKIFPVYTLKMQDAHPWLTKTEVTQIFVLVLIFVKPHQSWWMETMPYIHTMEYYTPLNTNKQHLHSSMHELGNRARREGFPRCVGEMKEPQSLRTAEEKSRQPVREAGVGV